MKILFMISKIVYKFNDRFSYLIRVFLYETQSTTTQKIGHWNRNDVDKNFCYQLKLFKLSYELENVFFYLFMLFYLSFSEAKKRRWRWTTINEVHKKYITQGQATSFYLFIFYLFDFQKIFHKKFFFSSHEKRFLIFLTSRKSTEDWRESSSERTCKAYKHSRKWNIFPSSPLTHFIHHRQQRQRRRAFWGVAEREREYIFGKILHCFS